MPKLYKQYCYQTLTDVKNVIKSELELDGFGLITGATSSSGTVFIDYIDVNSNTGTHPFKPPNCSTLGYANSFTGLDPADATLIGTLVVTVFALAWHLKILRRGL